MSKTIEQWKEVLSSLANQLVDYTVDYKYVENDMLEYYDEEEKNENLLCPLAIRLFMPNSEIYIGEEYGQTLYLNKTGDALAYEYDFEFFDVDNAEWIFLGYADRLIHQISKMKNKIETLEYQAKEKEKWTGLIDILGNKIYFGNIVHWTDGGDELSLEERIKTRWDRIAVVEKEGIEVVFKVFDSPSSWVKNNRPYFRYGNFIYTDTENYLTVVAGDLEDYNSRFQNAGQCMKYVLEMKENHKCTTN